jgi:monovalent cation:H+ antiporter-2, CPA2 family
MITDLQTLSLFEGCNRHQLRRIGELSTHMTFAAGGIVTRRADTGDDVVVVCSGTVVVERDGDHLITAGAGEIVGGIAPAEGSRRMPATVHALDICELLVLGRREFNTLEDEMPQIAARIRKATARRILIATAAADRQSFVTAR